MADDALEFHAVAKVGDVEADEPLAVQVGRTEIALYNLDGEIFATSDICSHAYASLSDGFMEGDTIECPLHAACFDIRTGKVKSPPAVADIETYPVKIEGDNILVGLKPKED